MASRKIKLDLNVEPEEAAEDAVAGVPVAAPPAEANQNVVVREENLADVPVMGSRKIKLDLNVEPEPEEVAEDAVAEVPVAAQPAEANQNVVVGEENLVDVPVTTEPSAAGFRLRNVLRVKVEPLSNRRMD